MHHSVVLAEILREFRNHPGIVLTTSQVMARWSLGHRAASETLGLLTEEGFLSCVDGAYFWSRCAGPVFQTARSRDRTSCHSDRSRARARASR